MTAPHLLLIDDDPRIVPEQVRLTFRAPEYRVEVATTGEAGVEAVRRDPPDVVLLDVRLPDQSGLEVYQRIRAVDARIPVIFVTTTNAADTAIDAMKQGAFDYLRKPLDLAELKRVVASALEVVRLHAKVALPGALAEPAAEAMHGSSNAMLEVYKAIGRVAAQDVTVLITGESGTGKELVARAIYQHSGRAQAPFLALNCAAIPEQLLESELFGHEKGAFTGADRRRIGKFEQCNGGTILLDEIGDMPLLLQAKLLRLLQERSFERVGGSETVKVDVRVLASSHRDLKAAAGNLRPDLYYRLSTFTIQLPPLRDRLGDLPEMARHFIGIFAAEMGREVRELAPEALQKLQSHAWPGNIRELQNVLRQALLRAKGNVLLSSFLPALNPDGVAPANAPFDLTSFVRQRLSAQTDDLFEQTHSEVDRVLLTLALEFTRGNHTEAARMLGISRQTMRVRLRALGLQVTHSVEANEDEG
ncbi:MAG TPA: sigma-54 dependent transcriptional regulator [Myxococcales bacterium]|jgi:two-component system nitrogen regulation response regulator GlnG|nr:sigma-54 dependent transcriptional regulator [Myxococcales bacterium]